MPDNLPDCNAIPRGREDRDRCGDNCRRCGSPMSGWELVHAPVERVCHSCLALRYVRCEKCGRLVMDDEMAEHFTEYHEEVPE